MASELLPDVASWEHRELHRGVMEALAALPTYFRTETFISGIPATDLHSLHGVLGVAIEDQVVATLNAMRGTWDPTNRYALYSFVRQPQTFPDVLLQRPSEGVRPEFWCKLGGKMALSRAQYPSDLTDSEWNEIQPLLPNLARSSICCSDDQKGDRR